jgi:predicted NBD/HSP70 family sugar kinase
MHYMATADKHPSASSRGRPKVPTRQAANYIIGAVLEQSGVRERELRRGFDGGSDTLTRNVTGLIAADWLRTRSAALPADRPLTLGPKAGHLIGIGVGREVVRCGIYRPDGEPVSYASVPTVVFPIGSTDALDPVAFRTLVSDLLVDCRRQLKEPVFPLACGVAWPSRVARRSGEPEPLVIRERWRGTNVRRLFREALERAGFQIPLSITNDADAEAIAETRLGVAQRARTVLVVKLAGGVGAAVIHDGEVLSGARGFAGELGHVHVAVSIDDERLKLPPTRSQMIVPLDPNLPCTCGVTGHLQTMVSTAAVVDRLEPGLAEQHGSYLAALAELETKVPSKVIDVLMHEIGIILGRALCGPVAMLDPDIVVLRSIFFPSSRLVDGVLHELRAASLEVPIVKLGTRADTGRWMGAQGAALFVGDRYARPRIQAARENWRTVPELKPVPPI